MAAGEAHWQNGIVERHIGTFREMLNKLMLEDVFEGADNQTFVDNVCEAKKPQWIIQRHLTKPMAIGPVSPSTNRHKRSFTDDY